MALGTPTAYAHERDSDGKQDHIQSSKPFQNSTYQGICPNDSARLKSASTCHPSTISRENWIRRHGGMIR
jgi:hypothetical protein